MREQFEHTKIIKLYFKHNIKGSECKKNNNIKLTSQKSIESRTLENHEILEADLHVYNVQMLLCTGTCTIHICSKYI